MWELLLGFSVFAAAGLGVWSFMTGKAVSDLWAGVVAAITGGSSSLVNVYGNYFWVLNQGLQFENWGFTLLVIASILFVIIMVLNFLTSRNHSFVQ